MAGSPLPWVTGSPLPRMAGSLLPQMAGSPLHGWWSPLCPGWWGSSAPDGGVPPAPGGRVSSAPGGGESSAPDGGVSSAGGRVPSAPGGRVPSARRGRHAQSPQLSRQPLQPRTTSPRCHRGCFGDSNTFTTDGSLSPAERRSLQQRQCLDWTLPLMTNQRLLLGSHQALQCKDFRGTNSGAGRQESWDSQEGKERRGDSPGFGERVKVKSRVLFSR